MMNDGVIVEPMQPIEINPSTKSDLVQKRKTELGQLEEVKYKLGILQASVAG